MSEPGDAVAPERPSASGPVVSAATPDATACAPSAPDDRTLRRAALREFTAMIGVEVFY